MYQPLPDDWLLGLSDVVSSTEAIASGQYKIVNTAGAAVIAGMTNALQRREFPFAFGGDGSSFAVSPMDADTARETLAATAAWARDELDLTLRVALVPVSAIREHGLDVRVARFAPSWNVSYAMFTGGGVLWAERAMKQGDFLVVPGPEGARPDLTGLSCRWQEISASRGIILSVVLVPGENGEQPAFRGLVADVLTYIESSDAAVAPVQNSGPTLGSPTLGLDIKARITHRAGDSMTLHRAALLVRRVFDYLIFRFGIPIGRFNPKTYRREMVENSDSQPQVSASNGAHLGRCSCIVRGSSLDAAWNSFM